MASTKNLTLQEVEKFIAETKEKKKELDRLSEIEIKKIRDDMQVQILGLEKQIKNIMNKMNLACNSIRKANTKKKKLLDESTTAYYVRYFELKDELISGKTPKESVSTPIDENAGETNE